MLKKLLKLIDISEKNFIYNEFYIYMILMKTSSRVNSSNII